MKNKLTFLFAAFLVSMVLSSQTVQPRLNILNPVYDFGNIKEQDGKVTARFEFTNLGQQPLILQDVKPSCGCTSSGYTKEPVLPGKKGFIELIFNPAGYSGTFKKSATVISNAVNSNVLLTITGVVERRPPTLEEKFPINYGNVLFKTSYFNMGKVNYNGKGVEKFPVYNSNDKPVKIALDNLSRFLKVEVIPPTLLPKSEGQLVITFDSKEWGDLGYYSNAAFLMIDGKKDLQNRFTIAATVEEDFSGLSEKEISEAPVAFVEKTDFDFGTIKSGEIVRHDFEMENKGKSNLIIKKIKASSGCTAAQTAKMILKPGEKTTIHADFDSSGRSDRQYKTISVFTNSPSNSVLTLKITGNIN